DDARSGCQWTRREKVKSLFGCFGRSAEFHSAVSPSCTRQNVGTGSSVGLSSGPQSATLRYDRIVPHREQLRLATIQRFNDSTVQRFNGSRFSHFNKFT